MQIKLETKTTRFDAFLKKASIHVELAGGGFTLSNILLGKNANGTMRITLPLMQIGSTKRPVITLQGKLKERIFEALCRDYDAAGRKGGDYYCVRIYGEAFELLEEHEQAFQKG